MKIKIIAALMVISPMIFSQNIINTLGTSGLFRIKDNSTVFLSLNQSNGILSVNKGLNLPNTDNSSTGIIYKEADKFIHNYAPPGVDGSNIFFGINSGNFTMSGIGLQSSYNTGIGERSLISLTTASYNVAIGYLSQLNNSTGNGNTGIGYYTLTGNISGTNNIAVGHASLNIATGSFNTSIGSQSGQSITTGSNNILIGYRAEPTTGTVSNQITLGDNQITSLRCNVTTITSLSDARDKKNINDLPLGLDFIMKLKPRQFNWDKREWYENNISDGSKTEEKLTAGFIAQELEEVQSTENAGWLKLVLKDNPEKLEATAGNLLPIVVKAIQELKEENEKLKNKLAELSAEVEKLKVNDDEKNISDSRGESK